jgi:hypothetical protein
VTILPPSSDDVKTGFAPIKLHNSVELHLQADPHVQRADLVKQLEYTIGAYRRGVRCRRFGPLTPRSSAR